MLLVFDASTLENALGDTFASISTRVNGLKKRLNRPYPIIIETISLDHNDMNYEETHNRRILSNYFIVRADRSLKAFRGNQSLYSQTLWLDWGASKGVVNHKRSDAPAKALYKYIKEVGKAVNQLKRAIGAVPFTQNGNGHIQIASMIHRLMN